MKSHEATSEDLPPLELRELRGLDLAEPPSEGMGPHVASASGVVRRGEYVYVIGDDMLQLAIFEIAAGGPGRLLPVLSGDLGSNAEQRAENKPDLEALTALPPVPGSRTEDCSASARDRERGETAGSSAPSHPTDRWPTSRARSISTPSTTCCAVSWTGRSTSRGLPCSGRASGCSIAATRTVGRTP
jgi:hypothetical protein